MRPTSFALLAVCVSLLASSVNAGLIVTFQQIESGDPDDELLVFVQITGTEGLTTIAYDLHFGGVGVSASNLSVGPVPGDSANCPTSDPPGPPPAPSCSLDAIGPANADGTNFGLTTLGMGPTGGTYSIGYQTIQAGTWDGNIAVANLVAFNNAGAPITDFGIFPAIPEPATAALLGVGLVGLAIGGRAGMRR